MIAAGDFFQLAPSKTYSRLAFSATFPDNTTVINLLTQYRHRADPLFATVCHAMRMHTAARPLWTARSATALVRRAVSRQTFLDRFPTSSSVAAPLVIFSTRRACTQWNNQRFAELSQANPETASIRFAARGDYAGPPSPAHLHSSGLPGEVTLCKGAVLVLIRNVNKRAGLVNGKRCVVQRFLADGSERLPVVRFLDPSTNEYVAQLPAEVTGLTLLRSSRVPGNRLQDQEHTLQRFEWEDEQGVVRVSQLPVQLGYR